MNTKLFTILWLALAALLMVACNPDGDETIALEYGKPEKMVVGTWGEGKYYRVDDEGYKEEVNNPDHWLTEPLVFNEDGTYITGDGKTYNWSFVTDSDGSPYTDEVKLNGYYYDIISMGDGRWILSREINGYTYYWEFGKTSSPEKEDNDEEGGGSIEGLGDISDKNPYKPVAGKLVSKITLERVFSKDNTKNKFVYLFKYDKRSRIIEYTVQTYNTITNIIVNSVKYNFIYDNSNVYLYCDGKILNKGTIGSNGYLATLYDGNSSKKVGSFTYTADSKGIYKVTYIESGSSNWSPTYYSYDSTAPGNNKQWRDMISNGMGDKFTYGGEVPNLANSVDFNGLFYTSYQWEWFMHLDKSEVIWGLFDFCGSRSSTVASSCQRGSYWTDSCESIRFVDTSLDYNDWTLSYFSIGRTALNSPFKATYNIEYYN